jgi:hypothetical protein
MGMRYNLAQPIPLSTARRLVEGYPDIFRWMEMKSNLLQPADFAHLEMIVKCVSPTFWPERAFAHVDICKFSKLAPCGDDPHSVLSGECHVTTNWSTL